jgi:hypothetical protein
MKSDVASAGVLYIDGHTSLMHRQASKFQDDAIRKLCGELNETETIFPGSDMRLVYAMIDCQVD